MYKYPDPEELSVDHTNICFVPDRTNDAEAVDCSVTACHQLEELLSVCNVPYFNKLFVSTLVPYFFMKNQFIILFT